jgi:drug/metabolite transporter (DMT)-like permease
MRLTQLVWNGLLGFVFLKERLSLSGSIAIALVVVGMLFVVSDFQWSSARMQSRAQIFVHSLTIFLTSLGSLVTKHILATLTTTGTSFQILDYLVWMSVLSLPPKLIASGLKEPIPRADFADVVTPNLLLIVALGTLLHELLQLVLTQLHKMASLLTLGVITQVRQLGTLVISYFVYRQTHWDRSRLFGAGLLVTGGILYWYSRMEQEGHAGSEDEARLIPDQGRSLTG